MGSFIHSIIIIAVNSLSWYTLIFTSDNARDLNPQVLIIKLIKHASNYSLINSFTKHNTCLTVHEYLQMQSPHLHTHTGFKTISLNNLTLLFCSLSSDRFSSTCVERQPSEHGRNPGVYFRNYIHKKPVKIS